MKFINKILISLALMLIPCISHGEAAREKPISFDIGGQAFYYSYEEPGVMEQDGLLHGIFYAMTYQRDLMLRLEGIVALGQVDYTSQASGSMDNQDNFMAETRGLIGYTLYGRDKNISGTVFTGIAYRYLSNEMEGRTTTTGHFGYDRVSQYFYSPVGASFEARLPKAWQIKLILEYDLFWFGKQESYLGYIPGYENITNDQKSGYGYRTSFTFEKKLNPKYRIGIEPFYRYWDIEDSEKTSDSIGRRWMEPANRTVEYGLNISFSF